MCLFDTLNIRGNPNLKNNFLYTKYPRFEKEPGFVF
ncbi:hypothetical protein Pint_30782 [Pistacia integerrima]|uniref:Uncharacterized protein n=1 Tax=Pistacia integerrima TaxID=434235 RepID=A0ACC0WXZ3_9ROSI|nr:hypothetical protein Pint_30782 [Pistacia integerrima]